MPELSAAPHIEFVYSPVINFAMQQNSVPVVRKLVLKNTTGSELQNISIRITSEPDFAHTWEHKAENLLPGESIELAAVNLRVSSNYLAALTERVAGTVTLTVHSGEEEMVRQVYDIGVLAFDQWNGITMLPEMLAAFVTPNHPQISSVIRQASLLLQKWTGSPSFDDYQTQSADRVRKQMAAIYEAITSLQITYCSVPASFEATGQRIRLCDAVFQQKLANCLDLSLLYAACLEAVGLRPLVAIIKGHAFAGAWLTEDSFADPTNDDISLLTKRIADGINEIALVEATCMNAGQTHSFDDAVRSAAQHLQKEEDFFLFVDVKRARFSGIRPLPQRVQTAQGWEVAEPEVVQRNVTAPEDLLTAPRLVNVNRIDVTKQNLWERKLLDLSLRNSLLNLRITKTTIQLLSVPLNKLEDALAEGAEFQVLPKPADWDNPLRNAGLYQAIHQSDPIKDLIQQEFAHRRLRAYLTENELASGITNLYRAAKLSLEENGANTLFMALGVLRWYETGVSERPRYAPILLMPVDIVRKSVQKGYVIRSREEDTMLNITLLEMLRQDFGIHIGLDALPKDDSGVDVRAVLSIIRQSVMEQSRWDVEEQAFLGTFSFSKFIMWNDIHHNADKLQRNKIVRSLMNGKMEWEPVLNTLPPNLDSHFHPSDIALPISTDSSQLEAICEAVSDNSFILHGPPGTGKSQTITNIIANALYRGKKVLFVAEKMAALQVVQSRLEAIGLGPFCLELHSNKSKKSAVLEQLKKAAEISRKNSPESFASEAERLHLLRQELNGYVDALHRQYNFGLSLYDAFTGYARYAGAEGDVRFSKAALDALTKEGVTRWNDLVDELAAAGSLVGHPHHHHLKEIGTSRYMPQLKGEAKVAIEGYHKALEDWRSSAQAIAKALHLPKAPLADTELSIVKLVSVLLLQLPDTPASLLAADNLEQTINRLNEIIPHGKKSDAVREELLKGYNKEILTFNAAQTLSAWNKASQKWFLPKWLKQNSIKKILNGMSTGGKVENSAVVPLLNSIMLYQEEAEKVAEAKDFLSCLLGFLWQGSRCDWQKLEEIGSSLLQLSRQMLHYTGYPAEAKRWRTTLAEECTDGTASFIAVQAHTLNQYIDRYNKVVTLENALGTLLSIDVAALKESGANRIGTCLHAANRWAQAIENIRDWCQWNAAKDKAAEAGLNPLVAAYEEGKVQSGSVVAAFQKGFYRSCAEAIFNSEPLLSSFNGKLFEEKIRRFRQISAAFEKLTKEELYARLAAKVPHFTQEASQTSEISILQKAIRTNGRGVSIRKLFDSIPNLLPRLHPCMLMSPISVAQYFDAGTTHFDLVVFDEASQMPTCEAVGAIARGSNVVVVGDPKQMPPTSFFSTNRVDEDNMEHEDLESILDDCLALSMPSKHLLWHYRSKHESLIAFSNRRYYNNQLLTFPSPDDISSKVSFVPVEGYYDRGKSKHNRAEAEAIVAEIIRRLSHPVLSKQSIGVVSFSSVQQILIDDMLNELLKTRPDLEAKLMQGEEPLFIKNLENVQGDERDVILFSVGYGPDKEGRLSLNFGPINRDGGWRRLNVAVSRARYEMKVFSTLRADGIDITRSASQGVADLKAFLEYAEKGKGALQQNNVKRIEGTGLAEVVAEAIRQRGYEAHTAVGCSGYRIDIGVVDKENPSQYILGVLCDGHHYHAAKTARDREIVQVDVLRLLGWTIHRFWSTEWWENNERQIEAVMDAIKAAEEKKSLAPAVEEVIPAPGPTSDLKPEDLVFNHSVAEIEAQAVQVVQNRFQVPYQPCQLLPVPASSPDAFLSPANRSRVLEQIKQVVEIEAPVSKNLLCKRVLSAWGITRMGTRILAQFDLLLPVLHLKATGAEDNPFYWKEGQEPDDYLFYRVPANESGKREGDDLCAEEVANAIREIVQAQISLSKDELVREAAKRFGFARIGSNVEGAMLRGLETAVAKRYVRAEGKRVVA